MLRAHRVHHLLIIALLMAMGLGLPVHALAHGATERMDGPVGGDADHRHACALCRLAGELTDGVPRRLPLLIEPSIGPAPSIDLDRPVAVHLPTCFHGRAPPAP